MEEAVNYAYNKGTTVIVASGNLNRNSVNFPARYDHTIAVGAVDSYLELASFSNEGINLDLVAPGKNIYSTVSKDEKTIHKKTEFANINKEGLYELDLMDAEYIFAWIDVTGNDKIDDGDYFAEKKVNVDSDAKVDVKLKLTDNNYELK